MESATRNPQPAISIGTLRVAGGTRLEDAAPFATALASPPRASRGREGERLFILLDLTGPASPHLYRELREVVAQTYWSTGGSITAALRQAAAAANRYLFRTNLHSDPSGRCYGGLTCAVLHGDDLFILQAGPAWACVLHGEHIEHFPRDGDLPHLGMGPLADVRLHHTFVATGDTLLLASPALVQEAGDAGIARVLPRAEVQEVLDGLEQIRGEADFTALVVRWAPPEEAPMVPEAPAPPPLRRPRRERPQPRPKPRPRPRPAREPGPGLGERMGKAVRYIGRGIVALGVWLVGGVSALFRRMLPGPERKARRRARPPRPIPEENRTVMMTIAIGIPIVLAIIVALAYLWFGADARFHSVINQAEEEIALAQAAGSILEEARPHWEAALEHATAAAVLRPNDPAATALQAQAQAALDLLDSVIRLTPVQLWDFGRGTVPRQLVVHGQMLFVLDPAGGWVAQLTLNPAGDGVIEEEAEIIVKTGQRIGERKVGDLVDFIWVDSGGERQTSGLLILEEDGALVGYDPAWGGEGGTTQLTHSFLGTPPSGTPRAVGSFEGRFYVLDATADQIWRYEPRSDTYPDPPDRYFVTPPPRPLATALDMAIDGNIYVLYTDGMILKFLGGERQPFEVQGLPGDLGQAIALAVDPDGSGAVYVADRGNRRVIVLGPDGIFQTQFRAEGAFDGLEALAVDEVARRLYVVSAGRLYLAPLP